MVENNKKIHVSYYALLREERGLNEEIVQTDSATAKEFYEELKNKYHFKLSPGILKVAINNTFSLWDTVLNSGDKIIFIPPAAGG